MATSPFGNGCFTSRNRSSRYHHSGWVIHGIIRHFKHWALSHPIPHLPIPSHTAGHGGWSGGIMWRIEISCKYLTRPQWTPERRAEQGEQVQLCGSWTIGKRDHPPTALLSSCCLSLWLPGSFFLVLLPVWLIQVTAQGVLGGYHFVVWGVQGKVSKWNHLLIYTRSPLTPTHWVI